MNWKLHRMLKEKCSDQNPQAPNLLEMGSCGIHVSHESATGWNLPKFLKNCYSIYKKSPAIRLDFLTANMRTSLQTSLVGKWQSNQQDNRNISIYKSMCWLTKERKNAER